MKDFRNIAIDKIQVRATGGSHIALAMREAVAYSMREDAKVEFVHNDQVYVIDPDKILEPIYEQHPDGE